jgi:3-oxoacid CoA-transferase subunit A
LGDFGINFFLNKTDDKKKKELSTNYPNFIFYCVRGNHEARPQDIYSMTYGYDPEIGGTFYMEKEYPNIRYFADYGIYTINDYKCGVIGGAYSVDKWYRLARARVSDKWDYNNPKITGWFPNEQLSEAEMIDCTILFKDEEFDFIFSHTCPYSWRPVDMFLSGVDQSSVDNSMELWMDEMKDQWKWKYWLWGHYHADRVERPHAEMFFNDIEKLDDVVARWKRYDETGGLDWWVRKSPNFDFYKK